MPDRPLRRRSGSRRKTASGGLRAEGGPELADGMRRSERPVDGHAAAPEWMGARGGLTPAGLSGLNGEGLRFRDDGACGCSGLFTRTAFLAGGRGGMRCVRRSRNGRVCPTVPGVRARSAFQEGSSRGMRAVRRFRIAVWPRLGAIVPGRPYGGVRRFRVARPTATVYGPTVHAGCPSVCIGTSGAVDVSGPFISTLPAERSCAVPAAAPRGRTRP